MTIQPDLIPGLPPVTPKLAITDACDIRDIERVNGLRHGKNTIARFSRLQGIGIAMAAIDAEIRTLRNQLNNRLHTKAKRHGIDMREYRVAGTLDLGGGEYEVFFEAIGFNAEGGK